MRMIGDMWDKIALSKYCILYSQWFNKEISENENINTKKLVKLIENQYNSMNEKERKLELIALKERINITKIKNKHNIKYCFYSLCLDILNQTNSNDIEENCDEGLLTEVGNWIFGTLEKISLFNIIKKIKGDISYKFVDLWIMFNLIASIFSSIIVYNLSENNKYILYIILIYSCLRVFEIIIYQINVLLFHPYRAKKAGEEYKVGSVTRMVIALLHNYVEIMFWYSTMLFSLIVLNGGNTHNVSWIEYIRSNVLCIVTLDRDVVKEVVQSSYEYLSDLIFFEIISGIIMTLISLARFIGALPGVESKEE